MKTKHTIDFACLERSLGDNLIKLRAAALEVAANAVVITDRTARVLWCNSAFEQLSGYTQEEIVGQNTRVLKSGQNSRALYEQMWRTILEGRSWRGELINRRKDGSLYDEEMTITPVQDSAGGITHFVAIKQDITERKRVEGHMRMLANAVEGSPEMVGMSASDGGIVYVNESLQKALQFSREEVIGKNFHDILSQNNSPALLHEIDSSSWQQSGWRGECLVPRKDGTDVPVLLSSSAVMGDDGRVIGILGIAQDITERKSAENRIRMLTERLSIATATAKIGVWELDVAGNAFTWDTTMFEIYGCPHEVSMPYEKWAAAVHPEDLPGAESILRQAIDEKGQGSAEFRIISADGTVKNISVVGRVLLDEHANVTRVLGTAQDITQRKRSEEQISMLAGAVESSSELMAMTDLEFRITFVNHALLHALRYSEEKQLLGKNVAVLMSPNNAPELFAEIATRTMGDGVWRGECLHLRADGTDYPILLSTSVVKDKAGRVLGILGIAQDITERKKTEDKLRRLAAIVESSDDAIIGQALDGTIQSWNRGAERMYGYSAAEAIGNPFSMLRAPGHLGEIPAFLEKVREGEILHHSEAIHATKDGRQIHVDLTLSPVENATGTTIGISTIARDVTERIKNQERLQLWSRVLDQSSEGIFICDPQERILLANRAFEQVTGFSADEAVGNTPRILHSGRQDRAYYADMWKSVLEKGAWQGEMWNRRKSGEFYAEWLSISAVYNHKGAVTHYIGIFSDITVRKQAEQRMVHLAHYDALTDLPNRALLMDRLNQLTKSAQRRKSKVAVVFIDLDRFKEVNDSLGHDAGDVLLQTVAKRFSNAVREEDTVARLGGDEFVVVFQGIRNIQDVAALAQKLFSCLREPVTLKSYEHTVTASMGISLFPDDAMNGQEMIRNADAAMYQAKGSGRNAYHFYTSDLNQRALDMLSMEQALRRAIEREQFVLHYQPRIDISSGSIAGAEALIRWNHPDLGLVMPGKFISIAEERGLIVSIGGWVIEEALRQSALWQNSGELSIPIAVNVSAVQFRQKDFVSQLANIVRKYGITPNRLELELTESIIMRDAEMTVKKVAELHDMGFQLSIDDFGTGYSSLSYLRRFPIDKLKIDQSFVRDSGAGGIVTAVIGLARSLKLKVIAEGVETKEQLEMLREQHCDEAQGFLFSPALTAAEFSKLVREWRSR